MACALSSPCRASAPASPLTVRRFADQRHTLYFGGQAAQTASSPLPPRRRLRRPGTTLAASTATASQSPSSRRQRVMQRVADVEETLRRLDESSTAGPLPPAEAAMPSLAATLRARRARTARAAAPGSSSSSDSSSSSSESEDERHERPAASRLGRRLQLELAARRDAAAAAASNIVPGPGAALAAAPPAAAAPAATAPAAAAPAATAPAAAAVLARVCTGKKCSLGGAADVVAVLSAQPGAVVEAQRKCMGQCKRCVAVKMAAPGSPETLYTGVNPANAAGVMAMHRRQQQPAAAPAGRL